MQQSDIFLRRFRFVFAGLLVVAFFMILSALVTAIGSHSIIDSRTAPRIVTADANVGDNPNVVTAGTYELAGVTKQLLISAGTALYGVCRSITTATTETGKSISGGAATIVHGIGGGTSAVGHGVGNGTASALRTVGGGALSGLRFVGSGVVFTLRLPGTMVGAVSNVHAVSAIIRPADDKPVPVIDSETSAEVIASLNARQKEEITKLLDAQIAANQALGGSIVAGDPAHGGYPAKWDNIRQDSQTDSWGMYNRECVSYAAWKVYQTYGAMPYWGGVGNANQWVRNARKAGIPTSPVPKVQSVAISMRGYYGHAMWVEKVSGNMIYVSQYNYDLRGHYSEMWVDGRSFTYIYFQ